jgi:LysR family transcriptional regulator, glycine cleavage system transcriptional activator
VISDLRDPAFIGALVHFDEAAKLGSFANAAKALGVSSSAVSHRIPRLEVALGKPLFERETRRVSLTHEGLELS